MAFFDPTVFSCLVIPLHNHIHITVLLNFCAAFINRVSMLKKVDEDLSL